MRKLNAAIARAERRNPAAEGDRAAREEGVAFVTRFAAMSVPGDRDDGADTGWHVYDRTNHTSRKVGNGPDAERKATELAGRYNAVGSR